MAICLRKGLLMGRKIKPAQSHLTLTERTYIEQELLQHSSFKSIAAGLHRDPTTIAKEVKRNSKTVLSKRFSQCPTCRTYPLCPMMPCVMKKDYCFSPYKHCPPSCRNCSVSNPARFCPAFSLKPCPKRILPPYVCNACPDQKTCIYDKLLYSAIDAQKRYETTLVESRKGINLTPEELQALNDLISPLILKGQPLSHIFAVHADEIPVCRRTLYNYLDQRVFQARNIDLHRRVRYKKRKKIPLQQKKI